MLAYSKCVIIMKIIVYFIIYRMTLAIHSINNMLIDKKLIKSISYLDKIFDFSQFCCQKKKFAMLNTYDRIETILTVFHFK